MPFCGCSNFLPLNPQGLGPLSPHLAFNTAVSFTTNTNWQSYGGEATMSYFSQMVASGVSQFCFRGHRHRHRRRAGARHRAPNRQDAGQFLGRSGAGHLLPAAPICLVFAVFLVSQGMIQNFKPYTKAKLIEPYKDHGREKE